MSGRAWRPLLRNKDANRTRFLPVSASRRDLSAHRATAIGRAGNQRRENRTRLGRSRLGEACSPTGADPTLSVQFSSSVTSAKRSSRSEVRSLSYDEFLAKIANEQAASDSVGRQASGKSGGTTEHSKPRSQPSQQHDERCHRRFVEQNFKNTSSRHGPYTPPLPPANGGYIKSEQRPSSQPVPSAADAAVYIGSDPYELDHNDTDSPSLFPDPLRDIHEAHSIDESRHDHSPDRTKRRDLSRYESSQARPLIRRHATSRPARQKYVDQQTYEKEEYSMWPANPFRSLVNNPAESPYPGTMVPRLEDIQDVDISMNDATGNDEYEKGPRTAEVDSARSLEPDQVHLGADANLYTFFSKLAERVRTPEKYHEISRLFNDNAWFDHKFAHKFGEEELRLLDQTLELLVDREFLHRNYKSATEATSIRGATLGMLTRYRQRRLCTPQHWSTVLLRSSTALVRQRFEVWPVQFGQQFMSELDMMLKTRPLMRIWALFFAEYRVSHIFSRGQLPASGSLPHTALQESFFASIPKWPRGDNPPLDQELFGAYILMMTIYIRPSNVPATLGSARDDMARNTSSTHLPTHAVSDSKVCAVEAHPTYESSDPSTVINQIVRNLPPVTTNTFWIRLVLAKISLTSKEAARVTSEFGQAIEALRSGQHISIVGNSPSTLQTARDELSIWLRQASPEDARQVSTSLTSWHKTIPADMESVLHSAAFISYLQEGKWAFADALLRKHAFLFAETGCLRKLCSALLRSMYQAQAFKHFVDVWTYRILRFSRMGLFGAAGVPRFWFYYHVRMHWKKNPFAAFKVLWRWGANSLEACPTRADYERLVQLVPSLASKNLLQLFKDSPKFAFENAMNIETPAEAKQRLCLIATRYALCLRPINRDRRGPGIRWLGGKLGVWLQKSRKMYGDDLQWHVKHLIDLRVMLELHSTSKPHDKESVADLFISLMELGDPQLDKRSLDFLRCVQENREPCREAQDLSNTAVDLFVDQIVDASDTFQALVVASKRTDKLQILRGLERMLKHLKKVLPYAPDFPFMRGANLRYQWQQGKKNGMLW